MSTKVQNDVLMPSSSTVFTLASINPNRSRKAPSWPTTVSASCTLGSVLVVPVSDWK